MDIVLYSKKMEKLLHFLYCRAIMKLSHSIMPQIFGYLDSVMAGACGFGARSNRAVFSLKIHFYKENIMKKILAFVLVAVMLVGALVSCDAGGDTNMHKLMKAAYKDGLIDCEGDSLTNKDMYKVETGTFERDSQNNVVNQDYRQAYAYATGGYYKHYMNFRAGKTEVIEDTSYIFLDISIQWVTEDNTVVVKISRCGYSKWDTVKNEFDQYARFEGGAEFTYDMNKYYENGKFLTTDATAVYTGTDVDDVGKDKLLQDCTDLLNEAFGGLNPIYTAKGYPIK